VIALISVPVLRPASPFVPFTYQVTVVVEIVCVDGKIIFKTYPREFLCMCEILSDILSKEGAKEAV
jgi:hypothetical protein